MLAPEDVFELEHGTALAELGQRVALRQVLQAARRFEDALPARRVRPFAGRQEVPTHVLDEDTYPVGGFASISNRGSIESLLHSQLAYMEPESAARPDLFDVKFLRDELLYYSRDENQFLRRRRTFVIVLAPDLVQARFKDADLPVSVAHRLLVSPVQGAEAAHGVVEFDLAKVPGITGGDGLRFGGRGADVSATEVFDFGIEDFVAADLLDEQRLGLDTLPHHGVVAGFGDVVEDVDFIVLVALALDSAFALLQVGRTPGDVDVVQGGQPGLHVSAGAHLLGATDED